MSPVDIEDALKAEHCAEFARGMQLWPRAAGTAEARNVKSAIRVFAIRLFLGLDPLRGSSDEDPPCSCGPMPGDICPRQTSIESCSGIRILG